MSFASVIVEKAQTISEYVSNANLTASLHFVRKVAQYCDDAKTEFCLNGEGDTLIVLLTFAIEPIDYDIRVDILETIGVLSRSCKTARMTMEILDSTKLVDVIDKYQQPDHRLSSSIARIFQSLISMLPPSYEKYVTYVIERLLLHKYKEYVFCNL